MGLDIDRNIIDILELFGYCRISTPKQVLDRQVRNILGVYPNAHIIREIFTGATTQGRKEWNKLYKLVTRENSSGKKYGIVFDSVSRMSRNADEGCEMYEDLFNKGVTLIFLKEPHINTEVYKAAIQKQIDIRLDTGNAATDEFLNTILDALNKYALDLAKQQIRIAFEQAEKELMDIHQRTSEGIKTAKLNGKQIGRIRGNKYTTKKEKATKEIILKNSKDFNGYNSDTEVMKIAGVSRNTYYKYKSELKEAVGS